MQVKVQLFQCLLRLGLWYHPCVIFGGIDDLYYGSCVYNFT